MNSEDNQNDQDDHNDETSENQPSQQKKKKERNKNKKNNNKSSTSSSEQESLEKPQNEKPAPPSPEHALRVAEGTGTEEQSDNELPSLSELRKQSSLKQRRRSRRLETSDEDSGLDFGDDDEDDDEDFAPEEPNDSGSSKIPITQHYSISYEQASGYNYEHNDEMNMSQQNVRELALSKLVLGASENQHNWGSQIALVIPDEVQSNKTVEIGAEQLKSIEKLKALSFSSGDITKIVDSINGASFAVNQLKLLQQVFDNTVDATPSILKITFKELVQMTIDGFVDSRGVLPKPWKELTYSSFSSSSSRKSSSNFQQEPQKPFVSLSDFGFQNYQSSQNNRTDHSSSNHPLSGTLLGETENGILSNLSSDPSNWRNWGELVSRNERNLIMIVNLTTLNYHEIEPNSNKGLHSLKTKAYSSSELKCMMALYNEGQKKLFELILAVVIAYSEKNSIFSSVLKSLTNLRDTGPDVRQDNFVSHATCSSLMSLLCYANKSNPNMGAVALDLFMKKHSSSGVQDHLHEYSKLLDYEIDIDNGILEEFTEHCKKWKQVAARFPLKSAILKEDIHGNMIPQGIFEGLRPSIFVQSFIAKSEVLLLKMIEDTSPQVNDYRIFHNKLVNCDSVEKMNVLVNETHQQRSLLAQASNEGRVNNATMKIKKKGMMKKKRNDPLTSQGTNKSMNTRGASDNMDTQVEYATSSEILKGFHEKNPKHDLKFKQHGGLTYPQGTVSSQVYQTIPTQVKEAIKVMRSHATEKNIDLKKSNDDPHKSMKKRDNNGDLKEDEQVVNNKGKGRNQNSLNFSSSKGQKGKGKGKGKGYFDFGKGYDTTSFNYYQPHAPNAWSWNGGYQQPYPQYYGNTWPAAPFPYQEPWSPSQGRGGGKGKGKGYGPQSSQSKKEDQGGSSEKE
jgi:hypothetical protein